MTTGMNPSLFLDAGRAGDKLSCIGVLRVGKKAGGRRGLDHLAEIHHRHPIGDRLDHRQIVADEQIGETEALLQIAQQKQTCAWMDTSSALTGSSSTMISASVASARAIAIRCACPPENSCG